MLISIITASLNSGQTIRNCIESVKSQRFSDFEHIVCDGGSSDDTVDILRAHQADYPLKWTSGADTGIANALNKAFEMTRGRYVVAIQTDDILIAPDILEYIAHCITDERYDIYSYPVIRERPGLSPFLYRPIRIPGWYHFKLTIPHQGAFVHRRLFERIGGFREEFSIAMDYDFFYRAFAAKATLRFFSRPVSRMGGCGISSGRQVLLKRLEEEKQVQDLNEKSRLWRTAQKAFRLLYIPYKTRSLHRHRPPCVRAAAPPLRDKLDILVITKRQYTNKDLIDDRYGRIREIPLYLARREHRVSGICLSFRKRREGIYTDDGVRWKSVNAGVAIVPGVARFMRQAFQSLKTCDVLWACSDSLFGVIGYMLSRRLNKPFVFDLYDNFESFLLARFPVIKALYRHAVRKCDAVTVVSRPLIELVRSYGRSDGVHLIENAVDRKLFFAHDKVRCRLKFRLPQQARIIGTAGSLSKSRGIETLFKSFQMLALQHPDIHLALAGPRDAPIPAHPRIHDMGNLEYDQIPLFLSTLDIGIICNRKGPFGSYCFPQKAREMMACNVPLVAANVEGLQSLFLDHPDWLFRPMDPGHLAYVVENRFKDRSTDYGPVPTWSDMAGILEEVLLKHSDARKK